MSEAEASHAFTWPTPHPRELLGRPSRKGVTAALEAHLRVLDGEPLRKALSETLREEGRRFGGQERRFIAFAVRELSRHQRLLDYAARLLGHPPSSLMLTEDQALVRYSLWRRVFCGEPWERIATEVKLPGPIRPRSVHDALLKSVVEKPLPEPPPQPDALTASAIRHSFPTWLAERLSREVAPGEREALFAALDVEPSIILRAREDREAALGSLRAEQLEVEPIEGVGASEALIVRDVGHRIFDSPLMKRGALQVQDLGSQLIVALCGARPGEHAADLCAGAGGKTIALADAVGEIGRVLAADASKRRLQDARDRVRALGLRQVSFPFPLTLSGVDVALIDAPCSGIGSLAREPEQKWKRTAKEVDGFVAVQRKLLADTAAALDPGARLVYGTCSLLREENEAVVEAFLSTHPDFTLEPASEWVDARFCRGPYLRLFPHLHPGGGFFGARLRKAEGASG